MGNDLLCPLNIETKLCFTRKKGPCSLTRLLLGRGSEVAYDIKTFPSL